MEILNKKKKNKPSGIKVYDTVVSEWKRREDIIDAATHNIGFQKYVKMLEEIEVNAK